MPVVLLVRHAQASFGKDNYDDLSEVGMQQALVVGAELRRRALRQPVAVSGALRRQRDTADIALTEAALPADVRLDERWDEYDPLKLLARYPSEHEYDGTSRSVQPLLDFALARWLEDEDAEESWSLFSKAGRAALDALVESLSPAQDAVVFTSGGVIAALTADLLGTGVPSVVALNRVAINGAITKLAVGSSGVTLVSFNDHAHFEGEHRALLTYR